MEHYIYNSKILQVGYVFLAVDVLVFHPVS